MKVDLLAVKEQLQILGHNVPDHIIQSFLDDMATQNMSSSLPSLDTQQQANQDTASTGAFEFPESGEAGATAKFGNLSNTSLPEAAAEPKNRVQDNTYERQSLPNEKTFVADDNEHAFHACNSHLELHDDLSVSNNGARHLKPRQVAHDNSFYYQPTRLSDSHETGTGCSRPQGTPVRVPEREHTCSNPDDAAPSTSVQSGLKDYSTQPYIFSTPTRAGPDFRKGRDELLRRIQTHSPVSQDYTSAEFASSGRAVWDLLEADEKVSYLVVSGVTLVLCD